MNEFVFAGHVGGWCTYSSGAREVVFRRSLQLSREELTFEVSQMSRKQLVEGSVASEG